MMTIKDLEDTWGNLESYDLPHLNILDDHVTGMLFNLQGSTNKDAIDYWTALSSMVKAKIEERTVASV